MLSSRFSLSTTTPGGGNMGRHLCTRYLAKEVKEIFERYLAHEIGMEQALALLKLGRRQVFNLVKVVSSMPQGFLIRNPHEWLTFDSGIGAIWSGNRKARPRIFPKCTFKVSRAQF